MSVTPAGTSSRDVPRTIRCYERIGFTKVGDFMLGGGEPGIGVALGLEVKQLRGVFMRLGEDPTAPVLDLVQFVDPPPHGKPYRTLNNIGICRIAFLVDNIASVCDQLNSFLLVSPPALPSAHRSPKVRPRRRPRSVLCMTSRACLTNTVRTLHLRHAIVAAL